MCMLIAYLYNQKLPNLFANDIRCYHFSSVSDKRNVEWHFADLY